MASLTDTLEDITLFRGMSEDDMRRWHVEFERLSPRAHQDFLESLGLEDGEVTRIREWSRAEAGTSD